MIIFEQIIIGETFDCGSHRFTAEEIKRFAAVYDPQPFHMDEAAAAKSHFGKLCASGWHTSAIMMRQFVKHIGGEIDAAKARGGPAPHLGPSLGVDDLKWLKPVFAGDEIAFSGEIVDKRASGSRPGWGIVSVKSTGINQRGEAAFVCTGHILVAMTGKG